MPNLARMVFDHAAATPARVALVVDERPYTYKELAEIAGRVGGWVRRICQADRPPHVGILAARSIETYAGILGACWAGGAYVPLNPRQPTSLLAATIARAGLDAIVVDRRGQKHLKDLSLDPIPLLQPSDWDESTNLPADPPAEVPRESPAYIIFTSGTTGVPKGVIITTGAVSHLLKRAQDRYQHRPQDRFAQFFETSFDASVLEMFSAWAAAASVHVIPETQLLVPSGYIRRHELTVWHSVPSIITVLQKLKQLAPRSLPTLRITCFGGEPLTVAAARGWQLAAPNCLIDNQYGPTEAAVACTAQRLTEPPVETPGRETLSIGTPFPGMFVDVVDESGRFLDANETGELSIAGPQLAAGYLDDPDLTARRFPTLTHPQHGTMRWYLTGDLGMRDAAGRLHHLGRTDNQVKILGHRVELEAIDSHLRAVCGTDSAAAIAWPIVDGHASGVVAFVAGSQLSADVVRDHMVQRVPAYMVPRAVRLMETLPLSANGKIDRKALRAMLDNGGAR